MMAGERRSQNAVDRLLAGYRPLPGVPDELLDRDGRLRPAWARFIAHFAEQSPEALAARFSRADQYLRDAGVFFRQYGEKTNTERAWPIAHVPVLLDEGEWQGITAALRQRADLLEALVADLYGPNNLVRGGFLPPSLIAGSREWLRPLVGVWPRGGHWLHFLAFEIGRGPDGTWWVLGDRTQAPSGAGFALENRVATSRAYADIYGELNVHRLANFFRSFRDALQGLAGRSEDEIGILTPGPLNDTYYEHAYIARYLGTSLFEGEDLTVEDGRVMVRTVEGTRPISVLWRRLDAQYADPLELFPGSRLGTPGLVSAVRQGNVTLVNGLGTGILETRALLAFLPRIAMALTGEPLAMPNIATWWCGQASERRHVRTHLDRMMLSPAHSTGLPFEMDTTTVVGARLRGSARDGVDGWLEAEGANLVGQETVTLSTTPAFENGRLVPRPMSLRVFLARTAQGDWQAMHGGFARIGRSKDATAIAMQRGGSVADVWVISDGPVDHTSLLPGDSTRFARSKPGVLPSRAGDNLFWLGRYVERAEGIMRLVRAYHVRLAETGDPDRPLVTHLHNYCRTFGVEADRGIPDALCDALAAALISAGHVRDRFSVDGWTVLSDLARTARSLQGTLAAGDESARAMGMLLRRITGFSGLVHENMYRFAGWRFLSIGRSLERTMAVASALTSLAGPDAPDGGLDLAVEIGDSVMTHRRRYAVSTTRETVVDLLALDAMNPRSILFQLDELRSHVSFLPGADPHSPPSELVRAVLRLHTAVAVETPTELDSMSLEAIRAQAEAISDLLSQTYFR